MHMRVNWLTSVGVLLEGVNFPRLSGVEKPTSK